MGWINIFSFTEEKKNIFKYLPWFFFKEKKWTKIQIKNWKQHKNSFIVNIKGINNRSQIRKFTNSDIIVSTDILPILKKNEYYWNDIINCRVFNIEKKYLGKVIDLIRTKQNDILVIKNKFKICKKQILIPFIEEKIIKNINTSDKFITVQWN